MQQQPIDGDLVEQDKRTQRLILSLVVNQQQRPWSVEEIVRAFDRLSNPSALEEALNQLQTVGLIHRTDELVFSSRVAVHIGWLGMLTV